MTFYRLTPVQRQRYGMRQPAADGIQRRERETVSGKKISQPTMGKLRYRVRQPAAGAAGRIRTGDLVLTKDALIPAELQQHVQLQTLSYYISGKSGLQPFLSGFLQEMKATFENRPNL